MIVPPNAWRIAQGVGQAMWGAVLHCPSLASATDRSKTITACRTRTPCRRSRPRSSRCCRRPIRRYQGRRRRWQPRQRSRSSSRIVEALRDYGIRDIAMPATRSRSGRRSSGPNRVRAWERAVRAARLSMDAGTPASKTPDPPRDDARGARLCCRCSWLARHHILASACRPIGPRVWRGSQSAW